MRRGVAACACAVVAAAGCGTRLPDSAFRQVQPTRAPATATATPAPEIRIGNIVSRTNFFDPAAFVGAYYGTKSYVDDLNARGGINGRRLVLVSCDDGGTAAGNVDCVRRLLDRDHVFALVGNAVLNYAGARIVQDRAVPDIGSQPIDQAYVRYSHLWDVLGESYPRDGRLGFDGLLHNGTGVYAYFAHRYPQVPRRAAVVSYNQASSLAYGRALAAGLRSVGYSVRSLQLNLALPDYDSTAISIRAAHANYVYDAIDRAGNERLCAALDDNRVPIVAKVTTTQNWNAAIRSDYADSPHCRNALFATGGTRNFDDTADPEVARFRAAMAAHGWGGADAMSEWALEAWAGAQWFADAARSCGAALTRGCVESFLARQTAYDGHGLLLPRSFTIGVAHPPPSTSCLSVARWSDAANSGSGGWVTQGDMTTNCLETRTLVYRP